jgi:transcriptional regulator with XRE-family HTH domain
MSQPEDLLASFGERVRELRTALELSQEDLGFRSDLDRTYISDIERGKRNVSLVNISALARALQVDPSQLLAQRPAPAVRNPPDYRLGEDFRIVCGFELTGEMVKMAAVQAAEELEALPFTLYRSIDLKTLSGIAGALFATHVARFTGAIVNPIEKGHPDVIPAAGASATEAELRNYGEGLEIKCTVGNVQKGSQLTPGRRRLDQLTGITWQAHHREVTSLMGLVIDFAGNETSQGRFPLITGIYFSCDLEVEDWGKISGTTGRNTKVTGMRSSGKRKMADGWVLVLNEEGLFERYQRLLGSSASTE